MVLPATVSPRVLPACALQGAFVSSFAVWAVSPWHLRNLVRPCIGRAQGWMSVCVAAGGFFFVQGWF